MAPGLTGKGDRIYQAGHNLIKAHAKAYHIYHNEFKRAQKGTWILSYFVVPSGNVCDYQNYYSELIFEMSVFFVLKTFLHYCIANANSLIKKNPPKFRHHWYNFKHGLASSRRSQQWERFTGVAPGHPLHVWLVPKPSYEGRLPRNHEGTSRPEKSCAGIHRK